jgi:4-hydroxymandelate oxidase
MTTLGQPPLDPNGLLAFERDADPRLATILSLAEFEPIARERMAPAAFDYVAGGSWDEVTLAENEAAWYRWRLRPRVLIDVSAADASAEMLGRRLSMPVSIAPMAGQALAHPDGEVAVARAAAAAGVSLTLSTVSSLSLEEVAAAAPDGTRWFQLYAQADPRQTRRLVERAEAAGFGAVVLTVDLPVLGYRPREIRRAFEHPGPFGNLEPEAGGRIPVDPTGQDGTAPPSSQAVPVDLESSLSWKDIATIRSWSRLPFVLKGILTAEDARIAVDHGVDGVIVSNHGARQLDRVHATADVLEEVVDAVAGQTEVWVDGGIRRGIDVAIALSLGARGVLVGRPMYWALATAGELGVTHALTILRDEFKLALALLGAPTVAALDRSHVERVHG